MSAWLEGIEAGMGRRPAWAAVAAVIAGGAAFATGLGAGDAPRTLAALIASWLFFAGAAAGALAFRAFFSRIVAARWARPITPLGGVQLGFAPVAMLVLSVIVVAARLWLRADADSVWLSAPLLIARQLVLTGALFGFAYLSQRPRPGQAKADRPTPAMAIVYCLGFAVVLSVWAFDFVLAPDPVFQSTLIGPFVFIGAFMAGTGLVILLALGRGTLGEAERRDASGLVLALSIFWAYLFWSQYLTIWYGNLPDEIDFALRRAQGGWGGVVLAVIGLVFVVPFLALLHPRGRRSSRVLRALIAVQLIGLWLTCHLLVVPSLAVSGAPPLGVRDVLVALGMLGAFALSTAPGLGRPVSA